MEDILNAIDVFEITYSPAALTDNSAKRFTTNDLVTAISNLTGTPVKGTDVYATLLERGYEYVVDETSQTMKYIWLVKYK